LETAEFRHSLPTGIAFRRTLPGAVTDYEERRVAAEYHYPWPDWVSLSHLDRAHVIAHSRIHHWMGLASHDAEVDAQPRAGRGTP
jgi:hypothetical protein